MEFKYKEMGTRIKVRRKELKIKQAELAETLEISNNHMSSIENGRQKTKSRYLYWYLQMP